MRDFPVFATDFGVSSLVLREIPYRQEAYIRFQDVQPEGFEDHLKECVSFCRMAGAEKIYAAGHEALERYPLYTAVLEMRGEAVVNRENLKCLFPVTEQTVTRWREICNRSMASVDNAGTLEARDETRILESGGAYFIHEEGRLLGIGWLEGEKLMAIAATVPGMGWTVANTLLSVIEGAMVTLEVASTNKKAIRLYEKLGFVPVREISRWFRVG